MKTRLASFTRTIVIALLALTWCAQSSYALPDALTSVRWDFKNFTMSSDRTTIYYDVYIRDVDPLNPIALPGFLIRLLVPQAVIGPLPKTVAVINGTTELDVADPTMTTSGGFWLMSFRSRNLITRYSDALMLPDNGNPVRLGTFVIKNTNGALFSSPMPFEATYSGNLPLTKSTISIFDPGTTNLSANSTTAQPETNEGGLGIVVIDAPIIPLTITNPTLTVSKTYDGNTSAAVTAGTVSGILSADVGNVTLTPTSTYDNANVGTGKTITTSYALSGTAARYYSAPVNYVVTSGVINAKQLTAVNTTVTTSKIYDGTTSAATGTPGAMTGVITADLANVTLVPTATYATADAASGKTITVTHALTGTAAVNYLAPVSFTATTNGVITAKPITVTAPTITDTKVYDFGTSAAVTLGTVSGNIDGGNLVVTPTGNYDTKFVGTGKTITVTYALSGSAAGNYSAPANNSIATGVITVKQLTAGPPSVTQTKAYDGTRTAVATSGTLNGVLPGDVGAVTLNVTALYDTKDVGTSKLIVSTHTISGTAATNYSAPIQFVTVNSTITAIKLTVGNPTITLTKPYDGLTTAAVTKGTLTGVLAGETSNVTLNATATYDTKDKGTSKVITVTYNLTGSDIGNYTIPDSYTDNTGVITAIQLTASNPSITLSKPYDGLTTAAVTKGTLNGVIASETGNITLNATAAYDTKDKGTSKVITVSYNITGTGTGNYKVPNNYTDNTGVITAKAITVSAPTITATKVYDFGTSAAVTLGTVTGNVDGGNLIVTPTGNYDTKDVGTGKTITVTYALSGSEAGNYTAPANNSIATGVITVKAITVGAPSITLSKVYDGGLSAAVSLGTVTGNLDAGNLVVTPTGTYNSKVVGTGKTITVTYALSGSAAGNYSAPANNTDGTGVITAKAITVSAPTITATKVYDFGTSAAVTLGTVTGNVDGSNLIVTPTGNYDTKFVGTGKTITVTYALSGSEAGNYTAPANNSIATGVITVKAITVGTPSITLSKVYDGGLSAAVSLGTVTGNLDAGNLVVTPTGTYNSKVVGTGKTITVTYALSGSAAGNYSAPVNNTDGTGVITAKAITVSAPTITATKVYDFGTSAVVTLGTVTGNVDGGSLIVTPTGNYDTKDVGTGKTITVTYALSGSEAGNYTAPANNSIATGVITVKAITVGTPSITLSKVYDGGLSAAVSLGTVTGNLDAGNLVVTPTGTYNSKVVGTGKTITVTYALSGSAAGNYSAPVNNTDGTGVITAKAITVSAPTITATKVYDFGTSAVVTLGTVTGNVDGGSLIVTPTGNYDTKDVGTGKTITVTYALSGSEAGNYTAPANNSIATGVITVKAITVGTPSITLSKVYDGSLSAAVSLGTVTGNLDAGNLVVTPTGTYNSKVVGTGKTITVTYALSGSAAGNYSAPTNNTDGTGVITAKAITVSAPTITATKVYDFGTSAAVTLGTVTGNVDGSNLIVTPTGNYDTKFVGTGKTITVTYALSGSEAGNYTAPANNSIATGVITVKAITVGAPSITLSKVYDGGLSAAVSLGTVTGNLDAGNLVVTPTGTYNSKVVGTGKTITVTYALSGSAAGNYSAPTNNTDGTGVITALQLTAANPASLTLSKPYDGTTTAAVTKGALSGVVAGDIGNVTLNAVANYTTAVAGTNKTINVVYSLTGSESANYIAPVTYQVLTGIITSSIVLTASTPALTLSRSYNGLTSAVVTPGTLSGVLPEDVANVSLAAVANYSTAAAGTGKLITVVYSISGSASGNYTKPVDYTSNSGVITAIALTAANPSLTTTKVYDGSTSAVVAPGTLSGVLAGETSNVTLVPTANYTTSGVGTNLTINVVYTLSGTAIANYTAPVTYTVTNAVITAKALTANNPALTISKYYDGNTSAVVTAGTLNGVIAGDVANVTLVPTGNYVSSSVGISKTINVVYTLSGTAIANYTAPGTYSVANGVILAKPLTASNPSITNLKIYDGSTAAAVTKGSLSGVVSGEGANVTLNATAVFDNANPGTNKTITVSYTLSGTLASSYTAPANYSIMTGEIDKSLDLKLFLEGLWNGSNMNKCKDGSQDVYASDIVDLISIELHDPANYSTIAYTFDDLELHKDSRVSSTSMNSIAIPPTVSGSYRITIKTRNHLETTSALGVSFAGNNISYDFTSAATSSYESDPSFTPTKLKNGIWMLYAGDSKHDSFYPELNFADLYDVFNKRSSATSVFGYLPQDFDGDGDVSNADIYFMFNNRDVLLYIP